MALKSIEIGGVGRALVEAALGIFGQGVALVTDLAGEDHENGALTIRRKAQQTAVHNPATANVQATVTVPAGTSGTRHVCTGVAATLAAGGAAPAAVNVQLHLRDGASGAGTILRSWTLSLPAVAGEMAPPILEPDLWIEGTPNTAMTIEFSAAAGANTFEAVSMTYAEVT